MIADSLRLVLRSTGVLFNPLYEIDMLEATDTKEKWMRYNDFKRAFRVARRKLM